MFIDHYIHNLVAQTSNKFPSDFHAISSTADKVNVNTFPKVSYHITQLQFGDNEDFLLILVD